jgi:hypothetical protein
MAAARTSALLCALATGALGWWWPEGSTEVDRDRNDAAAPACASPLPPSLLGLRIEPRRYTWPTRADLNVLTAAVPLSVLNCAHAKWRTPSGRAASESIVDSQPLWSMQVDRLPRLMVLASGWDGLTASRVRWRFSMKSSSVQVRSVQRCMRGTPSTHMPARHTRQFHVGTSSASGSIRSMLSSRRPSHQSPRCACHFERNCVRSPRSPATCRAWS